MTPPEHQRPGHYEKPKVTRVPLLPEEAVLTVCKAGSGSLSTQRCNKNQGSCVNKHAGS